MKRYAFLLTLSALFLSPLLVAAQAPSVTSFLVSSGSMNSGQLASFSWSLQDAGGYSFLIPCITGIKFKYRSGSSFSCGTRVSSTLTTTDAIELFITNVSGSTKSVTARIIPKDAAGQDVDSAGRDITMNVATHPQPITSFFTPAATTLPGKTTTISWASQDLDGVNLQIECSSIIRATSSTYSLETDLPCETPIFTSDLSPSNSLAIQFKNPSRSALPFKVTLLPAISPKIYDAAHAATITFTVASDILPDPAVTSFAASSTSINSGETMAVSWVTEKSQGANLRVACHSFITATSSPDPGTTIPCDTLAFQEGLAASGSLTLTLKNKSSSNQSVTILLLPSKTYGTYELALAKTLTITVRAPFATISPPPAPYSTPTSLPPSSTPPALAPLLTGAKFTLELKKGSQGSEVTALQDFLKRDAAIYPEAIVSGYFGGLTETAVKRFQTKYGLPASGIMDLATRAKLNEFFAKGSLPAPSLSTGGTPKRLTFTQNLGLGSRSEEVKTLQEFLARDSSLYPEKVVSGYFGALTELAVKRFQKKYGIAGEGSPGYGFVGPKTRVKLNDLQ